MMDINSCAFTGRLGADPEMRRTASGTPVCTFRLAVERMKPKNDDKAEVDWLDMVAWNSNAEFAAKHLTKGSRVAVKCRVSTRKWIDKDEKNHVAVEFVVDCLVPCASRQTAQQATAQAPVPQDPFHPVDDGDGDLPF